MTYKFFNGQRLAFFCFIVHKFLQRQTCHLPLFFLSSFFHFPYTMVSPCLFLISRFLSLASILIPFSVPLFFPANFLFLFTPAFMLATYSYHYNPSVFLLPDFHFLFFRDVFLHMLFLFSIFQLVCWTYHSIKSSIFSFFFYRRVFYR